MLRVEHLQKSFGFRRVLRDATFSVEEGETVGIFGRNGAGKTTLLRMIARISSSDGGDVTLRDASLIHGGSSVRADLLYLGHQPNLYPTLTGEENLELVSRLYGQKVSRDAILDALKKVGLSQQRWDPIRHYSRGMLQRLGLAKTVVIPWQVLLMDEPEAGLDEEGVELLQESLRLWQAGGRTMLIVSHDRSWLARFCNRILHLEKGQVTEIPIPESLTEDDMPIPEA